MTDKPEDPGGDPSARLTVDDEQDVPVDHSLIRDAAMRALALLDVPASATLAVTLVGPDAMAELKARALGERVPTDVLAFPMDDISDPMPGPVVIGDVVLCPEVARAQADAAGQPFEDELRMLLVHGILHCLGHDHAEPKEAEEMFAEQAAILSAIAPERTERS
jgi:probable rRNA maturation factor